MALLTLTNAHLAFGHVPLLDGTVFSLEAGERVALIGRNGTGKSSLLKVLAGVERLDDGLLQQQGGVRRVYVPQEPQFAEGATVFEAVAEGVAQARVLRERYGPWPVACHPRLAQPKPCLTTWTLCRRASRPWTAGPGSSACTRPCSA